MDIDLSGYSHEQDSHADQPISVPSISVPSILTPSIAAPCTTMDTVESLSVADEASFYSWPSTFYDEMSLAGITLDESQDEPPLSYSATTSPGNFDCLASMSSVSLGTSPPGIFANSDGYSARYIGGDSMKNGCMDLGSPQNMSFSVPYQQLETNSSISPASTIALTSAELLPSPFLPVWPVESHMMMQVNRSPHLQLPEPELYEIPHDATLSESDHMLQTHSGYVTYKDHQDSQSWPGFATESRWPGSSPSYRSAGSVRCGISRHSSKNVRRRNYSSSDVLYAPTSSIHSRRHSTSSSTGSPGTSRKTYICQHKECGTAFSRQADLDRHNDHIHTEDGKKKKFRCDYPECARASTPFYRKDHFRDHLRDQHKEDILKRGSNANQIVRRDISGDRAGSSRSGGSIKLELGNDSDDTSRTQTQHRELEDCSTDDDWWRCSRCLDRVYIDKNDWACPHCKGRIESARLNLRADRQAYQEARTRISPRVKEEDEMEFH